jgi:hypothetical protein
MAPATRLRTRLQMLLQIESSGFAVGLAILFVLVSLALPFWSISSTAGGVQEIDSFSWVTFVRDQYTRGPWTGTVILPYNAPNFPYPAVAGVAGNAYVLDLVFLVVLALVIGLFRFEFSRKMPTANLLILSLVVLGVALFALFYPIVAIPAAATTDVGTFTIGGFWGTAQPVVGVMWSWGPGLGWWLFLIGVILGVGGTVLPYLKSVRSMVPSVPSPMRPSP